MLLSACMRAPWWVVGLPLLALVTPPHRVASSEPPAPAPAKPAPPPSPAKPAPPPVKPAEPPDAVSERAIALREAAGLLDKAQSARTRGNRSLAEQLFSSAELIVGTDALADLSELFREGAPPRINTPLKQLPLNTPPQPKVV